MRSFTGAESSSSLRPPKLDLAFAGGLRPPKRDFAAGLPAPPSLLMPRSGTARSRSPSSNFTSYVPSRLSPKILPGYCFLLPLHDAVTTSPMRSFTAAAAGSSSLPSSPQPPGARIMARFTPISRSPSAYAMSNVPLTRARSTLPALKSPRPRKSASTLVPLDRRSAGLRLTGFSESSDSRSELLPASLSIFGRLLFGVCDSSRLLLCLGDADGDLRTCLRVCLGEADGDLCTLLRGCLGEADGDLRTSLRGCLAGGERDSDGDCLRRQRASRSLELLLGLRLLLLLLVSEYFGLLGRPRWLCSLLLPLPVDRAGGLSELSSQASSLVEPALLDGERCLRDLRPDRERWRWRELRRSSRWAAALPFSLRAVLNDLPPSLLPRCRCPPRDESDCCCCFCCLLLSSHSAATARSISKKSIPSHPVSDTLAVKYAMILVCVLWQPSSVRACAVSATVHAPRAPA